MIWHFLNIYKRDWLVHSPSPPLALIALLLPQSTDEYPMGEESWQWFMVDSATGVSGGEVSVLPLSDTDKRREEGKKVKLFHLPHLRHRKQESNDGGIRKTLINRFSKRSHR